MGGRHLLYMRGISWRGSCTRAAQWIILNEWAEFFLGCVGFVFAFGRQMCDTNRHEPKITFSMGSVQPLFVLVIECTECWGGKNVPQWQLCQRDNTQYMLTHCLCVQCVDVYIISDSLYFECLSVCVCVCHHHDYSYQMYTLLQNWSFCPNLICRTSCCLCRNW